MTRRQHTLQGDAIGGGRFFAVLYGRVVGAQIILQLLRLHGPAPGAFGKALQVFGDDFGRGIFRWQHAVAAGFLRVGHQRAFPFHPVQNHRGENAVALVVKHLWRVGVQKQGLAAMRKDVGIAAGDGVAKGCAAAAVDHVRGHHGEMQLRGHLQKHLEFIHLRLVFRRGDVQFEQTVHGLFAGAFANAQVRRLTTGRADAAGLQSKFVKTAVFRSGLS